ncbi:MAG TPA: hypothetical protein VJ276_22435, partial [Thermoanaerobaculia bacterium]|nr:hypothetical protein [Thermoanaerobaculia bacterium]
MRRALLISLLTLTACARWRDVRERFGGDTVSINAARVRLGDDPRFASPAYDDAWWEERLLYDFPLQPFWIRARVDPGARDGLYIGMVASYEVFWDGRRLGASGTARTDGPIDNFFVLPSFGRATHLLAIRVLAPRHPRDAAFGGIAIGDYRHLVRSRIVAQLIPLAALGVFLVIGVYYLSLWFAAARRPSVLVFALLCFAASLLVVAETWRWLVGYTYDWHALRMQVVLALTFAIALLLPLFFVLELGAPKPRVWAASIGAVLTVVALRIAPYDERCLQLFTVGVVASAAAVAITIPRRRWEALPSAVGIAIVTAALLAGGYGFSDSAFFLAFCALIVCLLLSLALQMRRQRREHESALLRAARLEIELLKKSIQPHFLMNTLTAVMEWIEEDPAEASASWRRWPMSCASSARSPASSSSPRGASWSSAART